MTSSLSKEDTQMANKHMERSSTSLVFWEMQMKTTMTYHFTLSRMAIIKHTHTEKVLARMWRNWNPCALLVGMQNDAAAMENGMVISHKIKHRIII